MAILSKPSRKYATVEHDPNGLSSVGSAPYGRGEGVKTYRPPFAETHLKRPGMYDSNPGSAFSPLPPAFNISSRHRKDQVAAGQRAELDHILDPEYKSISNYSLDDTNAAGPSRRKERTAGGLMGAGSGLRSHSSLANFRPNSGSGGNAAPTAGGIRQKSGLGGVYVDANGKVHDTEYDPFAGVAEVNRAKSRRRSAFGSERRQDSESGSSVSGSSVGQSTSRHGSEGQNVVKDEETARRRRESERRRFEDVAEHAAMVRRRSVMSSRSGNDGRVTPSLKSNDENAMSAVQNFHLDRLNGRSRSSQGSQLQLNSGHIPSPLSPTFSHGPSSPLPPVADSDERPVKYTETTTPTERTGSSSAAALAAAAAMPPPPIPKSKIEIKEGGTRKITGFDAPSTPKATPGTAPRVNTLLAPSSARLSAGSRSRASSETSREPRVKPAERPREEIYPETPAQQKKREERERRQARSGASAYSRPPTINTASGSRVLPEIQIVEDDDPRVIVPADGRSTRLQTKYTQADHVIRPFAASSHVAGGSINSLPIGSGQKAPSEILDEGQGGYVPTRWARGDKALRVTEDEKEKYRPKEWGGKGGDLAGKPEEWRPTTKEVFKKEWKDFQTHARFGLFKASKKLSRKAEF